MVQGRHRPTYAEINLANILWNYEAIKDFYKEAKKIYPIVKADAYGHGAVEVAKYLVEHTEVPGFGIAILDEALELREASIPNQVELLVMGLTSAKYAQLAAEQAISLTVTDLTWLKEAKKYLKSRLKIHLAIDTGMGRIGYRSLEDLAETLNYLSEHEGIYELSGIFTHFATADSCHREKVADQKVKFDRIKTIIAERGLNVDIHLANSAVSLWQNDYPTDIARVGIAIYGRNPSNTLIGLPFDLKDGLELHTELVHVKKMSKGETISYGAHYQTEEGEWIGTIPIGYADGIFRHSTGQTVLLNGQACPIVGSVCMDQMMISLPKAFPVGTKVTIYGENQGAYSNPDVWADNLGTISYELLCAISGRVDRRYIY